MPAVPGSMYQQGNQPSCFDKMKYGKKNGNFVYFQIVFDISVLILGFTIGFCVGMASGALFGGFGALR